MLTPFRADVPQLTFTLNRREAETYGVAVNDVFSALETYLGSTYVNQITKFGRTFDVYAQADTPLPPRSQRDQALHRPQFQRQHGAARVAGLHRHDPRPVTSISLYNLYPSAAIIGSAAAGYSSGEALKVMEQIAQNILPQGMKYQWTALSYQEKLTGAATVLFSPSPCCSSISCSRDNTKAGFCRWPSSSPFLCAVLGTSRRPSSYRTAQ